MDLTPWDGTHTWMIETGRPKQVAGHTIGLHSGNSSGGSRPSNGYEWARLNAVP